GAGEQVVAAVENARVLVPDDGAAGILGAGGLGCREQPGDPLWPERNVSVDDGHPFRCGVKHSAIDGVGEALVLTERQHSRAEISGQLRTFVRGAIVDDQNLVRRQALVERRIHAFAEQMCTVVVRYDDSDGRGHTRPNGPPEWYHARSGAGKAAIEAAMMGV